MTRTMRRVLIGVGVLVAAAVLAVVVAVYLLLQPDRFTALLQEQAQRVGLDLALSSPASPSLFPRPAVELRGITLTAQGDDAPILLASRGRLVLPWRSLLGGPVAITRMQVDAPRVDLGALQDWLSSLPPQPANAPRSIPRIDAGVSIDHGSLVSGNQQLLGDVALTAGALAPDEPFTLDLSAQTGSNARLQLRLAATPHMQGNALQLDNIQLHLAQGTATALALNGNARWNGAADASAKLGGKLDQADAGSYTIALTLTPANPVSPLLLHLIVDGPANHANLSLPPLELARWWNALGDTPAGAASVQPTVPPGSGTLQIDRLQMGQLAIQGLSVQAGVAAPAPAASAAAPVSVKPHTRAARTSK